MGQPRLVPLLAFLMPIIFIYYKILIYLNSIHYLVDVNNPNILFLNEKFILLIEGRYILKVLVPSRLQHVYSTMMVIEY